MVTGLLFAMTLPVSIPLWIVALGSAFAILAVKLLVLVLTALGFVGMWAAVFADVGVSMIAVLNALRAMKTE